MKTIIIGLTMLASMSSFASLNEIKSEFSNEIEAAAAEIAPVVMACATIKTMPHIAFKGRTEQEIQTLQNWFSNNCVDQEGSLNKIREDFKL